MYITFKWMLLWNFGNLTTECYYNSILEQYCYSFKTSALYDQFYKQTPTHFGAISGRPRSPMSYSCIRCTLSMHSVLSTQGGPPVQNTRTLVTGVLRWVASPGVSSYRGARENHSSRVTNTMYGPFIRSTHIMPTMAFWPGSRQWEEQDILV